MPSNPATTAALIPPRPQTAVKRNEPAVAIRGVRVGPDPRLKPVAVGGTLRLNFRKHPNY
jgi:hypothetical protein